MNSNEKEIALTVTVLLSVTVGVLVGVMGVDYREVVVGLGLTLAIPFVFLIDYVITRMYGDENV